MRSLILAGLLLAALPEAAAEEPPKKPEGPVEQLDSAMQQVLDALTRILEYIPQYELPEVLPNGDIIIRRVHPEEEEKSPETAPEKRPEDDRGGVRT